ncbi:MAG: 3-dehydroquinate synthase [Puniceicoccales bacterium]|jgi:3-dehydroquinate synthase|nr:3-dehydroquinate synthase [Puniceicoccales bacterium]
MNAAPNSETTAAGGAAAGAAATVTLKVIPGGDTQRAYPIHIGAGVAGGALERLRATTQQGRRALVVTSPNFAAAQSEFIEATRAAGAGVFVTSVDGERAKRAAELEALWEVLAAAGVDRHGVVVAAGGGVVGDLAGFAAATYLRGVELVQIPTTLLAMVDSAVGGKTGINLAAGKNLAGAFWQPAAVFADTRFLATLPAREFAAGMAEIVKYGLLDDGWLFGRLRVLAAAGGFGPAHPALPGIIRECCAIKAGFVIHDERETAAAGGRALLNLGHTFAHAIENVAGYGEYLHGEAVAIGLVLAARLSAELDLASPVLADETAALLQAFALPVALRAPLDAAALIDAMRHDKKARAGSVKFVLLRAAGTGDYKHPPAFTRPLDLAAPERLALLTRLWLAAGATALPA